MIKKRLCPLKIPGFLFFEYLAEHTRKNSLLMFVRLSEVRNRMSEIPKLINILAFENFNSK